MEVDLRTAALGRVRLHGVVTDFADFYSDGGVGPYDTQVVHASKHAVPIRYTLGIARPPCVSKQV